MFAGVHRSGRRRSHPQTTKMTTMAALITMHDRLVIKKHTDLVTEIKNMDVSEGGLLSVVL